MAELSGGRPPRRRGAEQETPEMVFFATPRLYGLPLGDLPRTIAPAKIRGNEYRKLTTKL